MAEEIRKENGQKFSSGNAYKENQTDFSALLKASKNETIDSPKPQKKEKPDKKQEEEKFKSLLSAAMEDTDFDELEDGFEEEDKFKREQLKNKEEKTEDPEIKESDSSEEYLKDNLFQKPEQLENVSSENYENKQEKNSNIPDEQNVKEEITSIEATDFSDENDVSAEYIEQIPEEKTAEKIQNDDKLVKIEESASEQKETNKSSSVEKKKDFEDEPIEVKPIIIERQVASEEEILQNLNNNKMHLGETKSAIEMFGDANSLVEGKTLKRKFNPNPNPELITGKDFNDPSLDDIYCYTYPDDIAEIRERKAISRQKKIEELKAEEERINNQKAEKEAKSKKRKQNKPDAPRKELKIPDKYPKYYPDPTDEEIDDKTGRPYYYFNFAKTLDNSKIRFLSKILPVSAINEVLYDKGFLDGIAERQHEKSQKLNNMSASEQYSRDLRNIGISIALVAIFIFSVFFKISFDIIPDNKYDAAIASLDNKDYENAYYQFTELGNKELSIYYAKYSEAKMYYKVEKYSEAKDAFSVLLPYEEEIFKPLHISITDEINECSYQIALNYYYDNDYESAKNIFKEIYTYADSTEKYYECGYKIAKNIYENWQDTEDLKKALKYFYRVRKYSQSDVSSYINIITGTLYGEAENYYNQKDYENALNIFEYLALFNYVNPDDGVSCSDMVNQCTYRYGLDLYKNRQYESARKILSTIPYYKDSYVLSKECIYNIASILYENNPVGSISEYQKIVGYKDADDTLYSGRLILYGKWKIIEMNKSSITPVDFSFYDDGQFRTNKQILAVAISTDARPIYYNWNGSAFATDDEDYSISCSYDKDTEKLTITCTGPTQQVVYTCKREMTYEEMIISEKNVTNTETGEQTLNQKFQSLIEDYINKKTDNIVYYNGEDVNIFDGKTD